MLNCKLEDVKAYLIDENYSEKHFNYCLICGGVASIAQSKVKILKNI
jgi:hypothetical protein